MKIVFSNWKLPGYADGVVSWQIGQALAGQGEDITFYTKEIEGEVRHGRVKQFRRFFHLSSAVELLKDRPDFAYAVRNPLAPNKALFGRKTIAPMFWPPIKRVIEELANEKQFKFIRGSPEIYIQRKKGTSDLAFGEGTILHTVCGEHAREYKKAGFGNRHIVVPHGVDSGKFMPRAEAEKQKGHERHKKFRILFVGHAPVRKGLSYLVRAFRDIRKSRKDVELLVLSWGVNSVSQEGVRLLGRGQHSALPYSEMPALYNSCDAFVLPSLADGTPFSVLEAMSCGLPAITSKGTGYEGIIKNGKNGFLVDARDSDAIKEYLECLIDSKKQRNEIGINARRTALLNSWSARAGTFLSELKRVG